MPLSTTVSVKNAQLTRTGAISGRVTDGATGIAGIRVSSYELVRGNWEWREDALTDASGSYSIPRLRATTHRIEFDDPSGRYLTEAWDGAATIRAGTDISVPPAGTASGKDAALAASAHITGTVSGPTGPLQNADVTAYRQVDGVWFPEGSDSTDSTGAFDVSGLGSGTYRLGYAHSAYLPEFYDDKATVAAAADIVLATGATAGGRNATLAVRGSIAGTVTNSTGTALAGIQVLALPDNGGPSRTTTTGASGDVHGPEPAAGHL